MSKPSVFFTSPVLDKIEHTAVIEPVTPEDLEAYKDTFKQIKRVLGPKIVQVSVDLHEVISGFMFAEFEIFVMTTFVNAQNRRVFMYTSDKNGVRYVITTTNHDYYYVYCTPETADHVVHAISTFYFKKHLKAVARELLAAKPADIEVHRSGSIRSYGTP